MNAGWHIGIQVVALFAVAACHSEVFVDGQKRSGSSGNSTASGVSTTGNGGACVLGQESFAFTVETHAKETWTCNNGFSEHNGTLRFPGLVLRSDSGGFDVDLCSPAADCDDEIINTVRYAANGLDAVVPVGSFVDVTVSIDQPWGCSHAISVVNLPEWDGEKNPVSPNDLVWLAAADGATDVLHPSIRVEAVPQECVVEDMGCGDLSQAFSLRFVSDAAKEQPTLLPGSGGEWDLDKQRLRVQALRAFESGCPDDYWNWAYIITQARTRG